MDWRIQPGMLHFRKMHYLLLPKTKKKRISDWRFSVIAFLWSWEKETLEAKFQPLSWKLYSSVGWSLVYFNKVLHKVSHYYIWCESLLLVEAGGQVVEERRGTVDISPDIPSPSSYLDMTPLLSLLSRLPQNTNLAFHIKIDPTNYF